MNTTKKAVSKKISVIISLIPLSLGYIEIFALVNKNRWFYPSGLSGFVNYATTGM